MNDGDFECIQCRTKLNETDRSCWRCGSRNLTDMRPSRIGAGPFNVPINHEGLGGIGSSIAPMNVGPCVPTADGVAVPPAQRDPNAKTGGVTLPGPDHRLHGQRSNQALREGQGEVCELQLGILERRGRQWK